MTGRAVYSSQSVCWHCTSDNQVWSRKR